MHTQNDFIAYIHEHRETIASLLDTLFGRSNCALSINNYDIKTVPSDVIPSIHFGAYADKLQSAPDKNSMQHIWVWCCAANIYCAITGDNPNGLDTVKTIARNGWNALHISDELWAQHRMETAPTYENVVRALNVDRTSVLRGIPCAPVIPWLTELYPEVGPWRGEILESGLSLTDIIVRDGHNTVLDIEGRLCEWSQPEPSIMDKLREFSSSTFAFYHKDLAFRVDRVGHGLNAEYAMRVMCKIPPVLSA